MQVTLVLSNVCAVPSPSHEITGTILNTRWNVLGDMHGGIRLPAGLANIWSNMNALRRVCLGCWHWSFPIPAGERHICVFVFSSAPSLHEISNVSKWNALGSLPIFYPKDCRWNTFTFWRHGLKWPWPAGFCRSLLRLTVKRCLASFQHKPCVVMWHHFWQ